MQFHEEYGMQPAEYSGLSFVVIWRGGTNIDGARRERIDRKQWIFSSEIVSEHSRLVATVRAWSAIRPNRLRGVLTLFAPTRLRSLSWRLLLTVVTGLLGDTSVNPLAWRARCAYSLTVPLVALLVLRFTCLTPSVRPYYVPRCSLLLALVLPPPSKSMLLADREFSLRLATARVTSFLPCLFLSLSRPFCSTHVASCEFLSYVLEKKRGLFTITKISGVPVRTVFARRKTWDKVRKDENRYRVGDDLPPPDASSLRTIGAILRRSDVQGREG